MAIPHGQKALLIDITRCIGCRACSAACQELHQFPGDGTDAELSATAYTVVLDKGEDRYVRKMCMHCVDPSCASVCPVGAFTKDALGPVTYDASRCLGCRYCMVACPFGVPKYEWSKAVPAVRKCDFCVERQKAGQLPACAEACPVEGEVVAVNADLTRQPSLAADDPFGRGWVLKVRSSSLAANLRNLLSGSLARRWMEDSREALDLRLMALSGSVLQDGGEPVGDFAKHVPAEDWRRLVHEFLLT